MLTTNLRFDGLMHEFFGAAAVLDKAAQAQVEAASYLLAHLDDRVIVMDAAAEDAVSP